MFTYVIKSTDVAPLAGAWIEIMTLAENDLQHGVAPLAGAWIEMLRKALNATPIKSLPSRERGLKFIYKYIVIHKSSRSPRGSVD